MIETPKTGNAGDAEGAHGMTSALSTFRTMMGAMTPGPYAFTYKNCSDETGERWQTETRLTAGGELLIDPEEGGGCWSVEEFTGIVSAVRLAHYLAGPEGREGVRRVVQGFDRSHGLNYGELTDAILLHLAQIATQEAGGEVGPS